MIRYLCYLPLSAIYHIKCHEKTVEVRDFLQRLQSKLEMCVVHGSLGASNRIAILKPLQVHLQLEGKDFSCKNFLKILSEQGASTGEATQEQGLEDFNSSSCLLHLLETDTRLVCERRRVLLEEKIHIFGLVLS